MEQSWLRSDGEGFFPKELASAMGRLGAFPVARWNFVVIAPPEGIDAAASFATQAESGLRDRLCAGLKAGPWAAADQFQCHVTSGVDRELLTEWARDVVLRQPMPAVSAVLETLNVTLAKASLPLGEDLRAILRLDPFGAYQDLLSRLEAQKALRLVVRDDFLVDPASGRVVIPMLLAHDPLASAATASIAAAVEAACAPTGACARVGLLGGHFAALENKRQVMQDMSIVSGAGLGCLVVALLLLKRLRQLRLLRILLPVALGAALATGVVVLMDGWIHGLTLSFGTGLVGLSVDYGVLAAFHARSPFVWRSNLMGLLTTLVVLAVLAFSSIPILRQLMIFAILGLGLSFALIYGAQRRWPGFLASPPLRLPPLRSRLLAVVTAGLVVCGIYGIAVGRYDLSLQRLNFTSAKTLALYQWFRTTSKLDTLFLIRSKTGVSPLLSRLHEESTWANEQGIRVESAAAYLPLAAAQERNRATWFDASCGFRFAPALDATQRRFFAPFLAGAASPCARAVVRGLEPAPVSGSTPATPKYLRHLESREGWISIFFPDGAAQTAAVKERYPEAFSLLEVASRFPALLAGELAWMTPLSLGAIAMILLAYFRNLVLAAAAMLPFLAGVGAVVAVAMVSREPINFVTMVALLMLCGLSVDYGVFAVDQWRYRHPEPARTQSALLLCCASSVLGIIPMALAGHPVLHSLGLPLCLGLVAALVTSLVGVPPILAGWERRTARVAATTGDVDG